MSRNTFGLQVLAVQVLVVSTEDIDRTYFL